MTSPSIIRRRLRFRFERSVAVTGQPNTMEVVVGALSNPTSGVTNTTFVDAPQSQSVVLGDAVNTCFFDLIPTDDPSLSERLLYRASWRSSYLGKQYTYDFAMPNRDCDFDDLFGDLQSIQDWHVYLQQSDLGVAGRVAKLNPAGQVVDAAGIPVSGDAPAASVQGNLDAEVVERQKADAALRTALEGQINSQIAIVQSAQTISNNRLVEDYQSGDAVEAQARTNLGNQFTASVAALQSSTATQLSSIQTQVDQLPGKADLGPDGKLLTSQLPAISLGHAVTVAGQTAMLALTAAQVQQGDFAVRPDGVWYLNGADPGQLSSWVKFTVAPLVSSINGQSGDVTLSAVDVGALPANWLPALSDVAGLPAALADKAPVSSVTALTGRVGGTETRLTAIESPASAYVRTSNGVIPAGLLGAEFARVSGANVLVNSQGQPIAVTGSGAVDSVNTRTGVVVLNAADVGARASDWAPTVSQVTGLTDALAAKAATSDSRFTNARTPTAHASTHAAGGSDAITPASIGARPSGTQVPLADVAGLQTALDAKAALTTQTDQNNRLSSVTLRVDALEGAGGFGGVSAFKVEAWDAVARTTPSTVAGFASGASPVAFKSPFGKTAAGAYYYDPTGAAAGEAVWPYISENGHLELRKWNESGPADPVYALASDLSGLNTLIAAKAAAADLTSLTSTVNTKAAQTALDALTTSVGTKATTASVTALTTVVNGKADSATVTALSNTVTAKADSSTVSSLTTTVNGKAAQTDLTALSGTVTALTTTVNTKAAQADLAALTTTVNGKASQASVDAKATTASVTALTTVVNGKESTANKNVAGGYAGLGTDGKLATSQMPALALMTAYSKTDRAGMLALTAAQVQPGDICTITAGADLGTYILTAADPSVFPNWLKLATPTGAVATVNGKVGTVVLDAADVGARASTWAPAVAEVTGLSATLLLKADKTTTDTLQTTKLDLAAVRAENAASVAVRQAVDYVATAPLTFPFAGSPPLAGGVSPAVGKTVLVTGQADSTQNGVWLVNAGTGGTAGSWSRSTDMNTGTWLLKGTLVLVKLGVPNSLWQQTQASGAVGTMLNNWTLSFQAGPVYTAGSGLALTGAAFAASPVARGTAARADGTIYPSADYGVKVTSSGIGLDRSVIPGKYACDVPAGNVLATIDHRLNTTDIVSVTVMEKATGDVKLLGWTASTPNTVVLEFASAPAAQQYRCVVAA